MTKEQNQNTNDNDNNPVTNPTPEESGLLLDGFKRVEARVRAVPSKECEQINLDIPSAVATVLGAYPEIIALRSALEGLKTFEMSDVDSLRDYGCALGHAHAEYRAAAGVVDNVGALAAECIEIRDLFHTDATSLSKRKLIDPARVEKLRGGNSYKMIAFDILGLITIFKEKWPVIQSKTALQVSELETAHVKANQLLASIGLREQSSPAVNEANLLRQQAYTLLVRAYGETRDAIAYIRRAEGDVDEFAPSLFAGRGRKPGTADQFVPQPTPTVGEPVAEAPAANIPVGFPGGSPLMNG